MYNSKKMETNEISILNIAYFCINSLAMLGKLDLITPEQRESIIEWIYSLQTEPPLKGGFFGSNCHFTPSHRIDESHITMIYCALACLLLLKDDLSRVNKSRIITTLEELQTPIGSFKGHFLGSEDDNRFVFCCAAIIRILGEKGNIDIEKTIEYVLSSQTYEGGFGHEPGDEAHGGATYCAIASLHLLGAIDRIKDKELLAFWLSQRQEDGFNGRTNKDTDTCYSFWIGSPLTVLGWYDRIVDKERLIAFIFSNYTGRGMFRANQCADPDLLHTHFSIAGLSLAGYPNLEKIHPALGFVQKDLPQRIITGKAD